MSTTSTARPRSESGRSRNGFVTRVLPVLLALLIVIASGAVHGRWTGRWSHSRALDDAVAHLARVPKVVGDWEGRDTPIDPEELQAAGVAGHVLRRYENRRGGGVVDVFLVCGRPGPISVHQPEVCYSGAGYELVDARVPVTVEAGPSQSDRFWRINVQKVGAVLPDRLHILYGWSTEGSWKASESARLDFAGSEALFKLYVIRAGGETDDDQSVLFLQQFLPVLRKSLFGTTSVEG